MRRVSRRYDLACLCVGMFLVAFAGAADTDKRGSAPTLAEPKHPPLHGRRFEHEGLPVLELWGSPEDAGYAHGFLFAHEAVALMDRCMLNERAIPATPMYENILMPSVRRQFVWDATWRQELRAMFRGMRDRLGAEKLRSKRLNRPLKIEDVMAANAMADWFGLFCSSFSVWGSLTNDGDTLTARNLDFPNVGDLDKGQIVVIYHGDGQKKPWVGVGWPGMIGVYTAMNRDGATISMHDSNGLPAAQSEGFTPRSLILRETLETLEPASFVADVRRVFERRKTMVANNIHVSLPNGAATNPAAVFEYDANRREGGVTVRLPAQETDAIADMLCCTNHMRLRQPARDCHRFDKLDAQLRKLHAAGEKLDPAGAMALIHSVRWQVPTLHSVVFEPNERRIHVHIPAVCEKVVVFDLASRFKKIPNDGHPMTAGSIPAECADSGAAAGENATSRKESGS